jgi:hypothetical protein
MARVVSNLCVVAEPDIKIKDTVGRVVVGLATSTHGTSALNPHHPHNPLLTKRACSYSDGLCVALCDVPINDLKETNIAAVRHGVVTVRCIVDSNTTLREGLTLTIAAPTLNQTNTKLSKIAFSPLRLKAPQGRCIVLSVVTEPDANGEATIKVFWPSYTGFRHTFKPPTFPSYGMAATDEEPFYNQKYLEQPAIFVRDNQFLRTRPFVQAEDLHELALRSVHLPKPNTPKRPNLTKPKAPQTFITQGAVMGLDDNKMDEGDAPTALLKDANAVRPLLDKPVPRENTDKRNQQYKRRKKQSSTNSTRITQEN